MYRGVVLFAMVALSAVCASAGVVTLGTFAVNPQSTFLWQSSNDVNAGALFISLTCPVGVVPPTTDAQSCVNAPAGTTLQIIGVGVMCYGGGVCTVESSPSLGGIFSSNNTLVASGSLPAGNVNRVTGSVASGASNNLVSHNAFLNTWYGNVDTTIPNDFYIPTGVLDSFFGDNSDPSHTLAVQVVGNIGPPTPEPASIGLFLTGLAFLGFRRLRSR
jgi:hypothetical protein